MLYCGRRVAALTRFFGTKDHVHTNSPKHETDEPEDLAREMLNPRELKSPQRKS